MLLKLTCATDTSCTCNKDLHHTDQARKARHTCCELRLMLPKHNVSSQQLLHASIMLQDNVVRASDALSVRTCPLSVDTGLIRSAERTTPNWGAGWDVVGQPKICLQVYGQDL